MSEAAGVKTIASLEPGKTYVLKTNQRFRKREDFERALADLHAFAPGCRFLLLDSGMELLGATPEALASVEELIGKFKAQEKP